jgi:NAD(P)-dependent dehydrogenase (short-subunit alcohol dehydrogenase family)
MYEVLEPNWQPLLPWPPVNVDQLRGRSVLVTGANRGYGLAIATHLASFGAHVVMHCRTEKSCLNGTETVRAAARAGGTARAVLGDLDSMLSVVDMVKRLTKDRVHVDVVVLNAAMVDPHATTVGETGVRRMFAVNYLANVVLIRELINQGVVTPQVTPNAAVPRVVVVSSGA